MASRPDLKQMRLRIQGATMMLSMRLRTGLGGLFGVTGLLFAMQLVTGTQAFPL